MKNSNLKTILLSLLVMALWGSLFPLIKIGYNAFNINASSIPDILMFASTRFVAELAVKAAAVISSTEYVLTCPSG